MQLKYNDLAEQKGVFVVGSCGFDSIPSDMGGVALHKAMEGPVNKVFKIPLTRFIIIGWWVFLFYDNGVIKKSTFKLYFHFLVSAAVLSLSVSVLTNENRFLAVCHLNLTFDTLKHKENIYRRLHHIS